LNSLLPQAAAGAYAEGMLILRKIEAGGLARGAPASVLRAAELDVARGRITRPTLGERSAIAFVADKKLGRVRVRLDADDDGLHARCGCGQANGRACRHAAALELLLRGDTLPQHADVPAEEQPIEELERQRRVERGASELFEVAGLAARSLPARCQVRSPSEQAYDVTVRSLGERHSSCTCPDFLTNRLGTCKHIEAVLLRLRKARARDGADGQGYLYLEPGDAPIVRLHLPRAADQAARRSLAAFFDTEGRLTGDLATTFSDLGRACLEAGIEVPGEVAGLAHRLADQRHRETRGRAVEAEVRRAGPTPPGFSGQLYGYQQEGLGFLLSRGRALLADDMGVGKTAQAIAALSWLLRRGEIRRALVICPASLKHQWAREIARFADVPDLTPVVVGGTRTERAAQYAEPAKVHVTSYELVRMDERDLRALAPDLVILDEAQRIKNWRIRTAAAVKRIPGRLAYVLTGTPLENRLDDLYSLMQVVDPHLLGPLWCFNRDFARLDKAGKPVGYRNLDVLRERLSKVMLRRRKDDVLHELPEIVVNRSYLKLLPEQRDIHDDAHQHAARLIHILKKRPLRPIEEQLLMRAFQRMRMACDAAGIVDKNAPPGSPKLDELQALLDDLCVQQGEKVVVFSEWERMQALCAEVCQKLRVGHVRLHGGVPSGKRGALIDRFREDPECHVFLSTDAGGVGLNLQVARRVINLDLPWNPAVLAQRLGRVHRIGQADSVHAVFLIAEDSFEQKLEVTLSSKRALFSAAVGDDTETRELERMSMARRMATVLGEAFAAETGRAETAEPSEPPVRETVEHLLRELGDGVQRILRVNGKVIAVMRDDAPPREVNGTLVLSASSAEAMDRFGPASPLRGAETLHAVPDPAIAERESRLTAAARKIEAAEALRSLAPAEALGLGRDAMALCCRALADAAATDDPAALLALLYGRLIPAGLVTSEDAAALSSAADAARAFSASTVPPPADLVAKVLADARALLDHVRRPVAAGSGAS
jgi:superfamily II DNA or RNA helicase